VSDGRRAVVRLGGVDVGVGAYDKAGYQFKGSKAVVLKVTKGLCGFLLGGSKLTHTSL
jgi:hypothetical protein